MRQRENVQTSAVEENFAKRFRLTRAPTVLAQKGMRAPIAFSRLSSDHALEGPTRAMPSEDAYTFQVALAPMPQGDIWIDDKYARLPRTAAGETFLFDLAARPVAHLRKPYDFLRFYVPLETLNQMAYEHGSGRIGRLRTTCVGLPDPVMHGLAMAILPAFANPVAPSALFVDAIALAFHAHIIHTHGHTARGWSVEHAKLAPWQVRRACEFIEARLDADPTIAEIAHECRLSASHFARAFRQTLGMPPHRWLMQRRIERAKDLLARGSLPLAGIALACGFVDQSHLSRMFVKQVGSTPGRWRRFSDRLADAEKRPAARAGADEPPAS